jgi:hypothetical protein
MKARRLTMRTLRECLAAGHLVEVDGAGTLRLGKGDRLEFLPETAPRVFIAYVAEDWEAARKLGAALRRHGYLPWLDREQLLPGQNWPRAIERALEVADFFVACFSRRAVSKRGQFQAELRWALDCAARQPLDDPFLLPVRFEPCEVPRAIQRTLHYVDLFPDFARGAARVAKAIREAAAPRPARAAA